jgi:hypothetical protein
MDATPPRPSPTVLAELAEVQRHLRDAPPHHGAGVRDSLQIAARRLERELAAARRIEAERRS